MGTTNSRTVKVTCADVKIVHHNSGNAVVDVDNAIEFAKKGSEFVQGYVYERANGVYWVYIPAYKISLLSSVTSGIKCVETEPPTRIAREIWISHKWVLSGIVHNNLSAKLQKRGAEFDRLVSASAGKK
jgi:hypothetical protein